MIRNRRHVIYSNSHYGVIAPIGLTVSPRNLDFGLQEKEVVKKRDVVITSAEGDFRVTNAVSDNRNFSVAWNPAVQTNSHIISIATIPTLPPGVTTGSVCVLTDKTNCPKVEISVVAVACSDLVVVPSELLLVNKR